jgi:hypothetical protein
MMSLNQSAASMPSDRTTQISQARQRPAGEPAAEERPQQPQAYRRDEQVRRPVVDLPDQQPAVYVEADGHYGLVRLAHRDAVQQSV